MPTGQLTTNAEQIAHILRSKFAIFTGSHDKQFRPLIIFPDTGSVSLPNECFSTLLQYFLSLALTHSSARTFVILIDRRGDTWSSVREVLNKLNDYHSVINIHHAFVLKPTGLLQRFFVESTMSSLRQGCNYPISFVAGAAELLEFIDPEHLPISVDGQFEFDVDCWIRDRMTIEEFRDEVDRLCDQEADLRQSLDNPISFTNRDYNKIFSTNPSYCPSAFVQLCEKRRLWLDQVYALECSGFKLRNQLHHPEIDLSNDCDSSNSSDEFSLAPSNRLSKASTFDLPVDKVFHIINLEHIIVRLTEVRSDFQIYWDKYIWCCRIVGLLWEVQYRINELTPWEGIWENLLECASAYLPTGPIATMSSTVSQTGGDAYNGFEIGLDTPPTIPLSNESGMNLLDVEALIDRLKEADQSANQLLPEWTSLFEISSWLLEYLNGRLPSSLPATLPVLSQFNRHCADEFQLDWPHDITLPSHTSLQDEDLPPIHLPSDAFLWPQLFDRLIGLAQNRLSSMLDQLIRLHDLHTSIDQARTWLQHGRDLFLSTQEIVNMELSACHDYLDALNGFLTSRDATIDVLTNPKLFRSQFASVVSPQLHVDLRELLEEVENVEQRCRATVANLLQHISRTSFPRSQTSPAKKQYSLTEDQERRTSVKDIDKTNTPSTQSQHPAMLNGQIDEHSSESTMTAEKRFNLAWTELIETERNYVNFLQHVHDVVWLGSQSETPSDTLEVPPFMRDTPNWLLINWPDLLCFHRDYMLPGLESCHASGEKVKQLASQFTSRLTDLYSSYCSLHPTAIQIATQLEQDKLYSKWLAACSSEVHRRESMNILEPQSQCPVLQLSTRLVSPVQRLQRYHMLVQHLQKLALTETNRMDFKDAHKIMLDLCETVNLVMRLCGLSIRPSELGTLIHRADFTVCRSDSRSTQQRHVFLFTNALLITKFRPNRSAGGNPRTGANTPLSELRSENRERSSSNHSLSNLPMASSLTSLVRSHSPLGGSNQHVSLNNAAAYVSGPGYEVREELLLSQIGLTPTVRADRRRFTIWKANRAQTYVFYSSDTTLRDQWVRSINDLLMDQLRRLRDESMQRLSPKALCPSQALIPSSDEAVERSVSLPLPIGVQFTKSAHQNDSTLSLPNAAVPPVSAENTTSPLENAYF